jgi:Uma2 family endonuclease
MVAATPLPPPREPEERRLVIGGLTFKDYVLLGDVLGHRPSLRLTYLEGTLEIMTTSLTHEQLKKLLGRLLELYALVRGVRIHGFGNATFRKEEVERGLEPDECYCIDTVKSYPDLAVEIVVSRPLVDKLAVYRGLGVREVWVYEVTPMGETPKPPAQPAKLTVHRLEQAGYVVASRSAFFPDLDPELLAAHLQMPDQDAAVRALWENLGGPRSA